MITHGFSVEKCRRACTVHACACVRVCVYARVCVCVSVYALLCMCVCAHVYIYVCVSNFVCGKHIMVVLGTQAAARGPGRWTVWR